jgi:hypothetical protein
VGIVAGIKEIRNEWKGFVVKQSKIMLERQL